MLRKKSTFSFKEENITERKICNEKKQVKGSVREAQRQR